MTITLNNACSQLTLTPEDADIAGLATGDSTICCTTLTLGTNCCTLDEYCIRSLYVFDNSVTGCGTETVGGVLYNYIDITYTGIDVACVTEVEINDFVNGGTQTFVDPADLTFRLYFLGSGPLEIDAFIRTCTDSCTEYKVENTIEFTDPEDLCNTLVDSGPTTTYPSLPTGVTISGNTFLVTPEAFGMTSTFYDGVYFASISQNGVIESDSIFIGCDVRCKVIDAISKDTCSNLYGIYQALVYSNDCTTIEYSQKCSLWEFLGSALGYFTDSPCETVSDCGCN